MHYGHEDRLKEELVISTVLTVKCIEYIQHYLADNFGFLSGKVSRRWEEWGSNLKDCRRYWIRFKTYKEGAAC